GLSTRVELRSVDPTANPYMAIAVLLAAGLDGIKHGKTPPEPVDQDINTMSRKERANNGVIDLPATLMNALMELDKDEIIVNALGEHLYTHFTKAKEMEWDMFRETVHPWEREQYLTAF